MMKRECSEATFGDAPTLRKNPQLVHLHKRKELQRPKPIVPVLNWGGAKKIGVKNVSKSYSNGGD